MAAHNRSPRLLIVTPEVTAVSRGIRPGGHTISARAGGLGDICVSWIHTLYDHGWDVFQQNVHDIVDSISRSNQSHLR